MTREEAIAILEDEAYMLYEDDSPYNRQAFDMAVEALKFRGAYEIAVKAANKAFENRWTQWVEWIPCSERLPEYGEPVLTWDGYCYCVEKRIPYIRDECGEPISSDWWVSDEYDERESDYYPNLRDGACIAWMPLPEPYTEE